MLSHGAIIESWPGPIAGALVNELENYDLIAGPTNPFIYRSVRTHLWQSTEYIYTYPPRSGYILHATLRLVLLLVEASLDDHAALVAAVAQADVVVSAMSGAHNRSHNIHLQHKLVEAIKDAGNVKVSL